MEWFKRNWLIGSLLAIVIVAMAAIVGLVVTEEKMMDNPVGLGILAFSMTVVAFLILVLKMPDKVTSIRINLICLSTLVAILTVVFGTRLLDLIMNPPEGRDTNTLEIVLSSLVGVGIGGLIAIAGQLVQDSGQDSRRSRSDDD